MSHPFVHIELSSKDRQEAAKFYGEIFGWQIQDFPEMNYTTFSPGEGTVGGGFNPVSDEYPAGLVIPYIHTDDIEATLAKIEAHGGKTLVPPMPIPGVGTFAHFGDPSGNRMALLQPSMEE